MNWKSAAAGMCGVLLPVAAAQADARFTGDIGLEMGGDEILTVPFTDGTSESIKGGDGLVLDAGVLYSFGRQKDVEMSLTVGWKYKAIVAKNGDVSLSRFPIEATLFKNLKAHRFGIGAAYHAGIKLSGSGPASWVNDYSDSLKSQAGLLVRYDYFFTPRWGVGGKYTSIKYDNSADVGKSTFDASSAGIFMTGRF